MKKLLLSLILSFGLISSAYSVECYIEYMTAYDSENFDNAIKVCTPLAENGDA